MDQHIPNFFAHESGGISETTDPESLFTRDVTSSGSFDLRGVRATSLGKLLQALPMPAILVDQSQAIVFANESWGQNPADFEEIRGRAFSYLFPQRDQAQRAKALIEKVFSDRIPRGTEVTMRVNDRTIWGRMYLRPLRMSSQRYILALIQDVTLERKQILLTQKHSEELEKAQEELERRVRERTAELAEANAALREEISERKRAEELLSQTVRLKAVAELAGGVAHSFNNLLQIVMGKAEAALADARIGNPAAVDAGLRQILETARFGGDIVKRLQSFAGLRSNGEPAGGAVFDLSDTVRQAVEMSSIWWEPGGEKDRPRIEMIPQVQDGCAVRGNEAELFQVVLSLIKNAVEALPSGGCIVVRSAIVRDRVVLEVRDNGVGIARKNLGKIFQPFFTTKGFQTSGLGLAASYGIVSRHGGEITVQSVEGQGSTFAVTLARAEKAPSLELSPGEGVAGRWDRVLVVDDFEPIVRILAEGLGHFGKTVYTALSGEEGLTIFKTHPVDLVICDLGMPGLNGFQVGERMRDLCRERGIPKPPFFMLTGWGGQIQDKERLSSSGVDMVIEKPLDLTRLLKILQEFFDKKIPPSNIRTEGEEGV